MRSILVSFRRPRWQNRGALIGSIGGAWLICEGRLRSVNIAVRMSAFRGSVLITMRRWCALASGALMVVGVLVMAPGTGRAGILETNAKWCGDGNVDSDRQIRACTWLLDSGQLSQENYPKAYHNRGVAYSGKGQYDRALRDFEDTIRLNPDNSDGYHSLAWLLATTAAAELRDGARAVVLAKRAVELNDDAGNNDTLAAVNARAGQFADAVAAQQRAIAKLRAGGGSEERLADFQTRLNLYQRGQPYAQNAK